MINIFIFIFILFSFSNLQSAESPLYCSTELNSLEPFVNSADAMAKDKEEWNPYIEKFAPVLYLSKKEAYFPISIENYVLNPETSMVDFKTGTVIIPPGEITMDRIYKEGKETNNTNENYFKAPECVKFGNNPVLHQDSEGNLTTPVYAIVVSGKVDGVDKIFIHYIFFYGYNGAYRIAPIGFHIKDVGAHEADIEHVTVQVDETTKTIDRVYFSAHSDEGGWHSDNAFEGTHPVIYVARGSHANYPKKGIYVRIFGFANDVTQHGMRWTPQIVRLYLQNDERFNPHTMGWMYHRGTYGKDAVSSLSTRDWILNPIEETDGTKNNHYCQGGKGLKSQLCLAKKRLEAFPPK